MKERKPPIKEVRAVISLTPGFINKRLKLCFVEIPDKKVRTRGEKTNINVAIPTYGIYSGYLIVEPISRIAASCATSERADKIK